MELEEHGMSHVDFFGRGQWMSPNVDGVTLIRRDFKSRTNTQVRTAELNIVGLGMFRVKINGKYINDNLYGTLSTDFHFSENEVCHKKFGEEIGHRIYVSRFNIAHRLRAENNCIGIELAPGWYKAGYTKYGHPTDYGVPKLCFRLTITYWDGSVIKIKSDDKLRWHKSNIVKHFFFEGEEHDYDTIDVNGWDKYGYDDSDWKPLVVCDRPETLLLKAPKCPYDRVIRTITPKLIGEYDGGFLYDAGENITGTPVIKCLKGTKRGEKLTFTVSERLLDGKLEDYTTHGQTSSFITDGDCNRELKLSFMWNGFRYIWVSGNAKLKRVDVIHSDIGVTSGFRSDDRVLNWIYETYIRTQLDNMHCGIPSDCPHLEKRGYTGDGELVGECGMLLLDSEAFYRKWIGDISDCQDRISGHVQYTAPYIQSGGGPGGWGCAISEVPYRFWKYFGDKELVKSFIPKIELYFRYLESHSDERGLVVSDQKGEWCLGDWCTAEDIAIPEPYVNTYFYIKTIGQLIEICALTGDEKRINKLNALREEKKEAIISAYYDDKTGDFCGGVQGANAFALDLGMGDERTLENLVKKYGDENEVGYDTGIFGTDIVTRVLFERGYTNGAYRLMSSEKKYSFGRWMNDGCTTFPEYWTYKRSQNHPMFGAVTKYLFTKLLGIGQETEGFNKIVIAPQIPDGLDNIEGFVKVKTGKIAVAVNRVDGKVKFRIEVPEKARFVYCGAERELNAGMNEFTI